MLDNLQKIENDKNAKPPWVGFWFDVASFMRRHTIFLFTFLWFIPVTLNIINIYLKLFFLMIAFILDRIAVSKAEDILITTVAEIEFQLNEGLNQPEEITLEQKAARNYWLKKLFLAFFVIICFHLIFYYTIDLSQNFGKQALSILYGIWGIWLHIIWSANLKTAYIFVKKIGEERLTDLYSWDYFLSGQFGVTKLRWLMIAYSMSFYLPAIPFNHMLFSTQNSSSPVTVLI